MSITPSIVASRSSGISPLYVHFDATGTTGTATSFPFHELLYTWDFGDTGASGTGTWVLDGLSKNVEKGPVTGHVFEVADGSGVTNFTVTLTVKDSTGTTATAQVTITVTDAGTGFSGASTICYSPSGNFTGAPSGSSHQTSGNLATIAAATVAGKRVLLHRGETYTAAAGTTFAQDGSSQAILGAYGTGAAPICQMSSNVQGKIIGINGSNDFAIMDLEIDGQSQNQVSGIGCDSGSANKLTIVRVNLHHNHGHLGTDIPNSNAFSDAWGVIDSHLDHCIGAGSVGFYASGIDRLFFAGNTVIDSSAAEFLVRCPSIRKTSFVHNDLEQPDTTKACIRIQGLYHSGDITSSNVGWGTFAELNYIGYNLMINADGVEYFVMNVPQDNTDDERTRDEIFEGNRFRTGGVSSNPEWVWIGGTDITVRNNIVEILHKPNNEGYAFSISRRGIENQPLRVRVYNNTVYQSTNNQLFGVNLSAGCTSCVVQNNLGYAPSAAGGSLVVQDLGSTSPTINHNSANFTTNPSFTSISGHDFSIQSGSVAIDVGTTVPVLTDYAGTTRPQGSAFDLGAFEFSSGATTTTTTSTTTTTTTTTTTATTTTSTTTTATTTTTTSTSTTSTSSSTTTSTSTTSTSTTTTGPPTTTTTATTTTSTTTTSTSTTTTPAPTTTSTSTTSTTTTTTPAPTTSTTSTTTSTTTRTTTTTTQAPTTTTTTSTTSTTTTTTTKTTTPAPTTTTVTTTTTTTTTRAPTTTTTKTTPRSSSTTTTHRRRHRGGYARQETIGGFMIPPNATIQSARRAEERDESGQPAGEGTVLRDVRARIDPRTSQRSLPDGNFVQIDGELTLEAPFELRVGDVVIVRQDGKPVPIGTGDAYRVVGSSSSYAMFGELLFSEYQLVLNPLRQVSDEEGPRPY